MEQGDWKYELIQGLLGLLLGLAIMATPILGWHLAAWIAR